MNIPRIYSITYEYMDDEGGCIDTLLVRVAANTPEGALKASQPTAKVYGEDFKNVVMRLTGLEENDLLISAVTEK